MNIKLLTFRSLQTVIADVRDFDTPQGKMYNLIRPLFVATQPTQQGQQLIFIPFLEWSQEWEDGIDFPASEFITTNTPLNDVAEQYRKMFSTIEIANAMPKFKK